MWVNENWRKQNAQGGSHIYQRLRFHHVYARIGLPWVCSDANPPWMSWTRSTESCGQVQPVRSFEDGCWSPPLDNKPPQWICFEDYSYMPTYSISQSAASSYWLNYTSFILLPEELVMGQRFNGMRTQVLYEIQSPMEVIWTLVRWQIRGDIDAWSSSCFFGPG